MHFIPRRTLLEEYDQKLSVNFIMFDGGSRFVLKHQLPHTIEFLKSIKSQYSMYDMLKYHTIHHSSFFHFSAMFYGKRINISERYKKSYKSIFEEFKEEKYITINAHLVCDIEEKFYINNTYSGSDHNLNPPSCDSTYMKNMFASNTRCLGDKQIHQHYFQYLKEALNYYHNKKQPVFSKLILMDSHDPNLKSIPRVDIDFYLYLKFLHEKGIMNKSVIIITADHGLQYGSYYNTTVYIYL